MTQNEQGIAIPDGNKPYMVIELNENGSVTVGMGLPADFIGYGMLKKAEHALQKSFSKEQSPIIAAPSSALHKLQ